MSHPHEQQRVRVNDPMRRRLELGGGSKIKIESRASVSRRRPVCACTRVCWCCGVPPNIYIRIYIPNIQTHITTSPPLECIFLPHIPLFSRR